MSDHPLKIQKSLETTAATINHETVDDVIVIGAGVSGLVTAFRLAEKGCRVRVLEAAPRAGGVIASGRIDGMLWESGPNSGMDTTPLINDLLDALEFVNNAPTRAKFPTAVLSCAADN
jgi:phytoene dehydrogenase-like protein